MSKSLNTRELLNNSAALVGMQVLAYFLPLIALPHLTRTLGVADYGVFAFWLSLIVLGGVIVDFGFDLCAPIYVAKRLKTVDRVRRFVGAVFVIRSTIIVIMVLVASVAGILFGYPMMRIAAFALALFGGAFSSFWLFHGIGKTWYITLGFLLARSVYVFLLFELVDDRADVDVALIAYGFSQLFAAAWSTLFIVAFGYCPLFPRRLYIERVAHFASTFFFSRIAVTTYTTVPITVLGLSVAPSGLALYSLADQLYRGIQGLSSAVVQALTPLMSRTRDFNAFRRIMAACVCLACCVATVSYLIAPQLVSVVFGQSFEGSVSIFTLFLMVYLINVPSAFLGYPFLGVLGRGRDVNAGIIVCGVIQIIMLGVGLLYDLLNSKYVVVSILFCELLILGHRMLLIRRLFVAKVVTC